MHVRRGFLGWGVFLILAGAIPLAVRAGWISGDQLARSWTLWPLILIGIGVGLVLSRTRFDFLGGLIVAATFGLMVGGLLSAGVSGLSGGSCGSGGDGRPFPARDGTFGTSGEVELELSCGEMTIAMATGSAWQLTGTDPDGAGPTVEADAASLDIRSQHADGASWLGFGERESWQLSLPTDPTLDLDVHLNAGSAAVDLAGARLGTVGLEMNAGSATIDLSETVAIVTIDMELNAGSLGLTLPNLSLTGSIQANAGAVRLCAPEGIALRLHTGDSIVAGYDYDGHGLVQDGSTWSTPGFESAAVRIELETKANAGSFTLDPEDGCG